MFTHSDYCTHIKNPEDKDILTRRLFDVNIRLLKTSLSYRHIIQVCCDEIAWAARAEKKGYKKPHGWSGANAGVPFNIIAVMREGRAVVMINPKITKEYGEEIKTLSNCGSLTLEKPIPVIRKEFIDLEYYTIECEKIVETKVDRYSGSFTILHEINHNLGILITDPV